MTKVTFRVDASINIGTGHVMRCLTLANRLRDKGAEVSFICRAHPGNLIDWLESVKGMKVDCLPSEPNWRLRPEDACLNHASWLGADMEQDALQTKELLLKQGGTDCLIVDHYALGAKWEAYQRSQTHKIMVIDDLADRVHDCDIILDQNFYADPESRYLGKVPDYCQRFLGPQHALLRPEFLEARKKLTKRDGKVRRILIFFGGSDPANETGKALAALAILNKRGLAIDVVVGDGNPHKQEIKKLCKLIPGARYYCQVDNMAQLMAEADLMLSAGGTTTWERCYLGLPSLTLVLALNQWETTVTVAAAEATFNLGWSDGVSPDKLAQAIEKAINEPARLREMGQKALLLMGGLNFDNEEALIRALMEDQNAGP